MYAFFFIMYTKMKLIIEETRKYLIFGYFLDMTDISTGPQKLPLAGHFFVVSLFMDAAKCGLIFHVVKPELGLN